MSNHKIGGAFLEPTNPHNLIHHVVGVLSGKGGVGKSTVTGMLAVLLSRAGYRVGILDADITGPSIPRMFGLSGMAKTDEVGIHPAQTELGIKVMSINLLVDREEDPVIWRGPILGSTVKQFWSDVIWGELDYLLIDMPPGTGDIPLTIFQSLPVDGVVIVTSPQDLVSMIVKKAYHMVERMGIPILGLVENMSYIQCPDCSRVIYPFGKSRLEETAQELRLPVLGRLPIEPEYAEMGDRGSFDRFTNANLAQAIRSIEALGK